MVTSSLGLLRKLPPSRDGDARILNEAVIYRFSASPCKSQRWAAADTNQAIDSKKNADSKNKESHPSGWLLSARVRRALDAPLFRFRGSDDLHRTDHAKVTPGIEETLLAIDSETNAGLIFLGSR